MFGDLRAVVNYIRIHPWTSNVVSATEEYTCKKALKAIMKLDSMTQLAWLSDFLKEF